MRKILLLAAAVAIPVSGVSLALSNGVAGAAGPKGKTVCSSVSGNVATTVTISGCVDSNGANTGGGSHPLTIASLANGGTVTWLSNNSTTFGKATLVSTSAKHCPGYVKGASSNPTADKISGSVSAPDTAGFKVPGTYKGEVCIGTDGSISSPKPLKVS